MYVVDKIKDFVSEECNKPQSKYWVEPFEFHFTPMVEYACRLNDELWWDREVIVLAAWLHDIGSIIYGRDNHHITWSIIAWEKLRELNYPEEKISLVQKCILNHRGSQSHDRFTLEEQIIAEADALSNFENLSWIFKAAFVYENLDQGQAKLAVKKKLENKYNQLHFKKSKEIIQPKYEAVNLLLS